MILRPGCGHLQSYSYPEDPGSNGVSTTEVPKMGQNRLIILDAARITKRTLIVAVAHTEKIAL
jgi:hypothetical protein